MGRRRRAIEGADMDGEDGLRRGNACERLLDVCSHHRCFIVVQNVSDLT
jgi:hypothetical protein